MPSLIAGLEGARIFLPRLADGGQGVLEFPLAAQDFGDVDQWSGILAVGLRQRPECLQRGVELLIVHLRLPQRGQRLHIVGLEVGGPLIGGDSVLVALELVVGGAEGELHARGSVALGTDSMTFAAWSRFPFSL